MAQGREGARRLASMRRGLMLRSKKPEDQSLDQAAKVTDFGAALDTAGGRARGIEARDGSPGFVQYPGARVDGDSAQGAGHGWASGGCVKRRGVECLRGGAALPRWRWRGAEMAA